MKTSNCFKKTVPFAGALQVIAVLIAGLGLGLGQSAQASTYYWDTNGATAGAANGSGVASGTWDSSSSLDWNLSSDGSSTAPAAVTTTSSDALIFSAGSDATSGTVTVSGTQVANTITLNQAGLTFTGGTIDLSAGASGTLTVSSGATINSALKVKSITFGAASALNLGGGSGGTASFGGANGVLGGTASAITRGSSIELTSGAYTGGSNVAYQIGNATSGTGGVIIDTGVTLSASGTFGIGGTGQEGVLQINGGAVTASSGSVNIGRQFGKGRVIITGGSLTENQTGGSINVGAINGTTGIMDVSGGTVNVSGTATGLYVNNGALTGSGTLNLSGTGVINTPLLAFGNGAGYTTGTATYLQTGGTLNVGTGGLALGASVTGLTPSITISGGTIGGKTGTGTGDWSSSLAMSLSSTNGNIKFRADDGGGTPVNVHISLSGILSDKSSEHGGLTKIGGGVLTLTGVNTYSGGTIISAGTAETGATGTFGTGDIRVNAGGSMTLGNATSIYDGANVVFDSTLTTGAKIVINLSGGSETVNSLSSISGTAIGPGTYTVAALNQFFGDGVIDTNVFSTIDGSTITVLTSAIPEPSTYALCLSGMAGLAVILRRRQNRQK